MRKKDFNLTRLAFIVSLFLMIGGSIGIIGEGSNGDENRQLFFTIFVAIGTALFIAPIIRGGWKYKKETDGLLSRQKPGEKKNIKNKVIRLDKCEDGEKLKKAAGKEKRFGQCSFQWGQHKEACPICRHKYGRNNK